MSTKHTAGPWKASTRAMLQSIAVWQDDRCVATVNVYNNDELTAAENARLIAAAPELLEALNAILNAEADSIHVGYDSGPGGGNYVYADALRLDNECFAKARAAIAKATGAA